MRQTATLLAPALLLASSASIASAQLLAAKDGPIVYGHHHVNASDIEAHKKFWADTLGGRAFKAGETNTDVIEFPNVLIFMRNQAPTAGTKGTTVDHIGFSVPDLAPVIARIKANGFRLVTRDEVAATQEVTGDIATLEGRNVSIAFVMGPDDVKVELVELKVQTVPITLHHVHFAGRENAKMREWYVKTFGARASTGGGGAFPTATLPGVTLNFTQSDAQVAGTTGRALDHVGFEVRNLEEFCKKLEEKGIKLTVTYRKVPALGIAIAFIRDPWGTNIELTEGLDKIS